MMDLTKNKRKQIGKIFLQAQGIPLMKKGGKKYKTGGEKNIFKKNNKK